jgi:hypothetical protein
MANGRASAAGLMETFIGAKNDFLRAKLFGVCRIKVSKFLSIGDHKHQPIILGLAGLIMYIFNKLFSIKKKYPVIFVPGFELLFKFSFHFYRKTFFLIFRTKYKQKYQIVGRFHILKQHHLMQMASLHYLAHI